MYPNFIEQESEGAGYPSLPPWSCIRSDSPVYGAEGNRIREICSTQYRPSTIPRKGITLEKPDLRRWAPGNRMTACKWYHFNMTRAAKYADSYVLFGILRRESKLFLCYATRSVCLYFVWLGVLPNLYIMGFNYSKISITIYYVRSGDGLKVTDRFLSEDRIRIQKCSGFDIKKYTGGTTNFQPTTASEKKTSLLLYILNCVANIYESPAQKNKENDNCNWLYDNVRKGGGTQIR